MANGWDQNVINHQNMLRDEPTGTPRWYQIQAGLQQAYADQAAHANDPIAPAPSAAAGPTGPTVAQQSAIDSIRSVFSLYGLSGLDGLIDQYITDGLTPDGAMIQLRQSQLYKNRFPAMAALAAKGRAITEGEYIAYERNAAALEQQYGLPKGMLLNNVTQLLTNEKSAAELVDDVKLAAAAAIQAPKWMQDQFGTYYGLGSQQAILAHFLDPDVAQPLLQQQYATTVIGAEAAQKGIDLARSYAERLQGLGISQDQARQGFGTVAALDPLTAGRGDTVTQQALIDAALAGDTGAQNDVQRAQLARTGRFQAGGGFIGGSQGVGALGSANT